MNQTKSLVLRSNFKEQCRWKKIESLGGGGVDQNSWQPKNVLIILQKNGRRWGLSPLVAPPPGSDEVIVIEKRNKV